VCIVLRGNVMSYVAMSYVFVCMYVGGPIEDKLY
jgi:hypothetical protein